MARGPKADPRTVTTSSMVVLSDGSQRWGLPLVGGHDGFGEAPIEPNTLLRTGGGEKWGTFDPVFGHIEQSTWVGGRGNEDFEDDPTKYFDAMNAWTLTPRRLCNSLQWKFAEGTIRDEESYLPGNMEWKELHGTQRYYSQNFTVDASNLVADKAYMWIRRRGTPGTLTFTINSDSSGDPGTVLQTVTKTTTDITDVISIFQVFDWTSTQTLTASTKYHVVVYGASADSKSNHWEIGGTSSVSGARYSTAGSVWTEDTAFKLYYRVVDADIKRRFMYFSIYNCLFAIDSREDGADSNLFINGDIGMATGGAATTLTDTNAGVTTWTTNCWANARVRIVAGTGAGQDRLISSNTTTVLTVSVAWQQNPSTDSVYVIYDTDTWTEIAAATVDINNKATDVVVVDNIVHVANGYDNSGPFIWRMHFDSTAVASNPIVGQGTDDVADCIWAFEDPDDGMQIWRAVNSTAGVSRATKTAWADGLTFGTAIQCGGTQFNFLDMIDYNNSLYVRKQDGLWSIVSDEAQKLNVGLDKMPEWVTYSQMLSKDLFLYVPFQHSLETLYAGNFDDMGPWRNAGMPADRSGVVSCMDGLPHLVLLGINAGDGTSSVMAYDGRGYCEIMRAWEAGQKIEGICIQPIPGGRNRVWVSVGGDMVYFRMPKGLNPFRDISTTGADFQHEAVIEYSAISMGAHLLYKYFKEMVFATKNLHTAGREIYLDYQVDENVGSTSWVQAGSIRYSPRDVLTINEGSVHRIRPRLRLCTNSAKTPVEVWGTVLMGFGRKPSKRQWVLKVKVDNAMRMAGGDIHGSADDFYKWLFSSATQANGIRMTASWKGIDDLMVVVQPPTVWRRALNAVTKLWSGQIQLTVMEA